ncbi:MAG TPA: hypothetical protein VE010_23140 [Thermoanaerobaculia bacterium]|nr:hypothetical protein [Thermoanaerobaculia bacterium]
MHEHFIPFQANIHDHAQRTAFRRFGALWTPSVLILDADGVERFRIEGFLPKREFHAHLAMALARLVTARKRWADAEPHYARIVEEFADTTVVPEALYWRGVSAYQGRRDHVALETMATEITARFPGNVWAIKAAVWLRE